MPRKKPQQEINAEYWLQCADPLVMLNYLETAGCYLEFEPFFMNCFDRIRHEFHTPQIADTVFNMEVDVDELTDAANAEIENMTERLSVLDQNSDEWSTLNREIIYSRAVLTREYHDFGEANRFLSSYLIEIADDPKAESEIQAEFLRKNFRFPYVPSIDE